MSGLFGHLILDYASKLAFCISRFLSVIAMPGLFGHLILDYASKLASRASSLVLTFLFLSSFLLFSFLPFFSPLVASSPQAPEPGRDDNMSLFSRSQGDRGGERTEAAVCKPTDRGCVCSLGGKGCSRNAQEDRRRNIKEDCFRDGKADFINRRKGKPRLRTRRLSIFLDKIEKICRFQSKISCGFNSFMVQYKRQKLFCYYIDYHCKCL